jgi:hypothetical protein
MLNFAESYRFFKKGVHNLLFLAVRYKNVFDMNLKQKLVIAIGAFALSLGNGMIASTAYDSSTSLIVAVISLFGGLIWFSRSIGQRHNARA